MGNSISEIFSSEDHPIINRVEITSITLLNLYSKQSLSLFTTNSSYLLIRNGNCILIYNIESLKKTTKIKCDSFIYFLEFHPKFEDVFIASLENGEIDIWKINSIKPICIIKAHNKIVICSIFNPEDIYLLVSTSFDKTLKIWNINEISLSKNILLEDTVKIMKWSLSGNYLGVTLKNNKLIIFDKKDWSTIFSFRILYSYNFEIINKNIFLINDEFIESRDFQNKIIEKKIYNNNFSSYCIENNYIFFFGFENIMIFNISKFKYNTYKLNNKLYISESKLINITKFNNNLIANVIAYNTNMDMYFKIKIEFENEENNTIKEFIGNEEEENTFLTNIIPIIFNNKEKLHYSKNIKDENDIKKPKYFTNQSIESELCKKSDLFKRKNEVSIQLKNNIFHSNLDEEYIFYLKLMIKDNTNITLLKNYLKFLQLNQEKLKKFQIENFDDEIKRYQCCFQPNDKFLKDIKFIKKKSEWENFKDLLISIKNSDDFLSLKIDMKKKSESFNFFNQPIDLNNIELMNYRNQGLIIFSFKDLQKTDYNALKIIITYILDNKILENEEIINDQIKITLLILIIIYPNLINYKFYLNMLDSKKYNYNDKTINEKISKLNDKNEICINNLNYLDLGDYKLNEIYNFNYLRKNPPLGFDIKKLKEFLLIIFQKQTFKDALETLYENPNFVSLEGLAYYLINHIIFIPYKSDKCVAVTDKFTSTSFIFTMDKDVTILSYYQKKLFSLVLKTGIIIVIIFHEINHNIYSLYFDYNNNNIPLLTPRKEEIDKDESGNFIELLLFGRIIKTLNVQESLYILNENNYDKNLSDFLIGFNQLNDNDLFGGKIYNEFNILREYFKNDEKSSIIEFQNTIISAKPNEINMKECYITNNNQNDLFGMRRDEE